MNSMGDLVIFDGGGYAWRTHRAAMKYARARATLHGTRQRVTKRAGLWVVKSCS